jgi:hypothetical protein
VRPDLTVFNAVRMRFTLAGVPRDRAGGLIEQFQKR